MTTVSAKVIADSFSPTNVRLTTVECRYPRWIHAEGRTHRQLNLGELDVIEEVRTPSVMEDKSLSRNASSSRAIPVKKLVDDVMTDPAVPLFWGKNQKGMQADEECENRVFIGAASYTREAAWLAAMQDAVEWAKAFEEAGYHKQLVNRLLEPFSHITTLLTASGWSNFFALRRHPDAEPHIHMLADAIYEAIVESKPQELSAGQWHLPYIEEDDRLAVASLKDETDVKWPFKDRTSQILAQVSIARCARVSYFTHDRKKPMWKDDEALYERLVGGEPLHASPAEHVATPDRWTYDNGYQHPELHGNLYGWVQYRRLLPGGSASW